MKKKITFLSVVLLMLVGATNLLAQDSPRKTWDFTKGLSEITLANCAADPTNWGANRYAADGVTITGYKDLTKMSGILTANGEPIAETNGLIFGTAGLSNNNNYLLDPASIRMSRANMTVSVPQLVAGQKITIVAKSANSESARGITNADNNVTRIEGPADGTAPGADGDITHIFTVNDDITEPTDIAFKIVTGGVDIKSIMIDEGDAPIIKEDIKIAYLYDSSYSTYCGIDEDPVFSWLSDRDCEAIDVKDFTPALTDTVAALESNYDLVVVTEAIGSGHAFVPSILSLVNRVPMLNFKSFFYKDAAFGWGEGKNPEPATSVITVNPEAYEHYLFTDLGLDEGNLDIDMFAEPYEKNMIQGYTAKEGGFIADDEVLATVAGMNAIHVHGSQNIYMLIPISYDGVTNLGESAQIMIMNASAYLANSKSAVRSCSKPTISQEYKNGETVVTLDCVIPGAIIYYTIDGTEPTESSTVYTEPLTLTTACTINVMANKVGYNPSDIASAEVIIKTQLAKPVIFISDGDDNTKVVTMTGPEGATIHYNLSVIAPTSASEVYTEPFVISRTTTVMAMAAMEGMLDSDAALAHALIPGYTERYNLLAHADFFSVPTTWGWIPAEIGEESTDSLFKGQMYAQYDYNIYPNAPEDSTVIEHDTKEFDFKNGWKVATSGQRIFFQQVGISSTIADNYGPATTADDGFTKGDLSFLQTKTKGDMHSGRLLTTQTYAGPFDIAVWMCSQVKNVTDAPSGEEVLEVSISTDGELWTVLDSLKIPNTKAVRKKVAHYDGNQSVYVKLATAGDPSITNTKLMLFDVKLFGEGGENPDGVELPSVAIDKEVVGVQIYNISGMQLSELGKGLNIVRRTFSDGSVEVIKVMKK